MDSKFFILLTGLLAVFITEAAADEGPSNLRMDLSELLLEAKDAIKIAKLRKHLAKKSHRQRMQEEALRNNAMKTEREASAAVADVERAIVEAHEAMKSLKRMAAETAFEFEHRQRNPEPKLHLNSLKALSNETEEIETKATSHAPEAASSELTDPDESNADIKKLVKKTHENLEKKPDHEIVISKGMTKDVVKTNGQIAKKLVKESEDKKANGEEIVDKQANLEIDREPAAEDPEDPVAEGLRVDSDKSAATGPMYQVFNFLAVVAFTFLVV